MYSPGAGFPPTAGFQTYNPMQTTPGMMGTMHYGGLHPMSFAQPTQPVYSAYQHGQHEDYENTFPQPMGTQMRRHQEADAAMRESFEAHQHQPLTAREEQWEKHEYEKKHRKAGDYSDQIGRAMLWSIGSVLMIAAFGLLISSSMAMNDEHFLTFSSLSSAASYPSFFSILRVFVLVSVAAFFIAAIAFCVGWKEIRQTLKVLVISSFVLGILLLIIALWAKIYSSMARPDVVRVANLICQDVAVWNCMPGSSEIRSNHTEARARRLDLAPSHVPEMPVLDERGGAAADAALGGRLLSGLAALGWHSWSNMHEQMRCWLGSRIGEAAPAPARRRALDLQEAAASFVAALRAAAAGDIPRGANSGARRLTVAAGALRYHGTLDSTPILVDYVDGRKTNEVCRKIAELCAPPPDFDPATACVCRQMWDWANPGKDQQQRQENSTEKDDTTRRLGSSLTVVADPHSLDTLGSLLPTAGHRLLQGDSGSNASLGRDATSQQDGASSSDSKGDQAGTGEPAVDGPGPWKDTKGAYCNSWSRNDPDGSDDQWCFVTKGQACHPDMKREVVCAPGGQPETCIQSGGPCTDAVDSRSFYVTEGLQEMDPPLLWAAVLGVALVMCGFCGLGARMVNRTTRQKTIHQWAHHDIKEVQEVLAHAQPTLSIDQRFEAAQREAVNKLKDSTPQDKKFLLYGYYMQAKEGDVRGEQPGIVHRKERQKWQSWKANEGMPREVAIDKYIQLVSILD